MVYKWSSEKAKLLKRVRMSGVAKLKNGWSREVGAGFIKDDLKMVYVTPSNRLGLRFQWNQSHENDFITELKDLNLRETEELLVFLKESHQHTKRGPFFLHSHEI